MRSCTRALSLASTVFFSAAALADALRAAAAEQSPRDLEKTLRGLLALAQDGHGWADLLPYQPLAAVLLRTTWMQNRLVVTAVDDSIADRVRLGDVVLAIDGRPSEEVFAELGPFLPGSPQWTRVTGSLHLTGIPGSSVTVRLQNPIEPDADVREVAFVRNRRCWCVMSASALVACLLAPRVAPTSLGAFPASRASRARLRRSALSPSICFPMIPPSRLQIHRRDSWQRTASSCSQRSDRTPPGAPLRGPRATTRLDVIGVCQRGVSLA